uniref:Galectin n=1 Tax=Meloidogyne hapla TaxID=6305 RepID=A0A1I8BIU2_MELHA
MGNTHTIIIPFEEINLTPGNVVIEIDKKYKYEAQSSDKGDGMSTHDKLIRGKVVRVAAASPFFNQHGTMLAGHLKIGDEANLNNLKLNNHSVFKVWVRGRKGFPIEVAKGVYLFVFNEWDVAINIGGGSDQPPMYNEKVHF